MNVGVFEAKNRLSELLERAAKGEEVVITKHGKPAVRLTPVRSPVDREQLRALFAEVRAERDKLPFVLDWDQLKRDRDEGRRY